ncbi:MAG: FHA domain-containing protein [Woeseiaceae bacterium]|nr:FHA domain-containing protein [Woeseiaceae bacterium]
MANDNNNNSNALVSDFDDEATTELELIAGPRATAHALAEPENEEHTSAVDDATHDRAATVAELQSDLALRNQRIEALCYDLELLRGRRKGLEEELRAREALTDKLHAELRQRRDEFHSIAAERAAWQQEKRVLEDRLAAAEQEQATTDKSREVEALQQRHTADSAEIDQLQEDLLALRSTADEAAAIGTRQDPAAPANSGSTDEMPEARKALAEHNADLLRLEAEMAERDRTIAQQAERLAALAAENDTLRNAGTGTTASSAGRTDDGSAEVFELREQLRRTEHYADVLRRRLQDSDATVEHTNREFALLQGDLEESRAELARLTDQLELEMKCRSELENASETTATRHDATIRELHARLQQACEDLAAQAAANERLTVQLAEIRGARQQLEETAAAAGTDHARQAAEFDEREAGLNARIAALEEEIAARDEDIASLFNELAGRSSTAVRRPPAAEQAAPEESDAGPGDGTLAGERCTRLLVGRVDGQTLRFPLFKDRLTIGRLPSNDIQLPEACVSRLHAIIECTGDGCSISDTGSKNGIYLNGANVERAHLQHGDQIIIGTAAFRFEERPRRQADSAPA